MNRLRTASIVPAFVILCMALLAPVQSSLAGDSPVQAASGDPKPPPGAAVFEMKYRGLSGPDDSLSYGISWSFGAPDDGSDQKDPFVLAVKDRVKECTSLYNSSLPRPRWSVVELRDKKPVAFYFDLNADGKLSDEERFLPITPPGSESGYRCAFITSDFLIRTDDRREIPFRVMLLDNKYGAEPTFLWTPACVLEGLATLGGRPMRLVLFSNRFSGSFTDFGQCRLVLLPGKQELEGYTPDYMYNTLSGLIHHQGAFYRLKLQGTHTKDSTIRVVLEKDTSPTGQVAFEMTGKDGLKTRLTTVWLEGAKDATIQLRLTTAQPTLPVGQYRMSYGDMYYGLQSNDEWNVSIKNGAPFDIRAAGTTRVSFGQPVLSIKAIEEKDRSREDAKERSTFAKGTEIYLAPQIKGKGGEVYTQFAQKTASNGNPTDVKPHVTIRDPDGKTVAWADMEYG